ncbi:prolyl-tRNA synthetase [Xanthomonas phaseoli pv. phaseoli]|uniref:Cys-tRNA(Pro)/Cys-tRNA(Cys) deacylase n=1 Tax=Xanthomonas campestris pv. phaseoli TaxID=317013 RepID=A0AB38DZY8_XANCH|nr:MULTISPECIES: Cys-tRNA(Pro) deacylase [Xanthomonas]ATS20311.1 Cys-tRNA(Pro) deacylase [Xanthomonas phaseoli pv. phaseoli]ATS26957.1 Cys-tRNA(Pro) deacylase [Xanthomonas phaseoli pv. phaseoli]ATS29577.1 Cys-tRNA(Pro) deacylase [Xanthomonas phaseoli pv. phaseoli]ATS35220.1 Cys-tRNA(Pro) deacylase [Xanthomonas phaseoli pv. phaseoli]AZU12051.1 prolyl-tRNA synthetase [Xanthomonas phaseoli pv. phaseoli]
MSKATRATKALDAAGVGYVLHPYDYQADADAKGLQAAHALGLQPHTVLKTLMAWVDDTPVCVVIPCDRRVSLKKLASACGGKSARMMEVADAERRTGYKVGGISPLGQQRQVPVLVEITALDAPALWINAGQRGLLLELPGNQLMQALAARACALCE